MGLPVVVLLGRPNVGKSSLFNRLLRRRRAIVAPVPGVTRDPVSAVLAWRGRRFLLVDTGGLAGGDDLPLAEAVARRARAALEAADLVLLVVDGRQGLHPADREVARLVRRARKPALLVVNKVDRPADEPAAAEFYALGLGEPLPVSAEQGLNTGELLDRVAAALPRPAAAAEAAPRPAGPGEGAAAAAGAPVASPEEGAEPVRVCVVGRPNVGKSSLVNRLVGGERVIVSPLPGTTREPLDLVWEADGRRFTLVDTAGLRRRTRVREDVEFYGAVRTLRAVERCDVALVVLDATQGVVDQDRRIAGYAHERGRGCVLLLNKWDLVAGRCCQEATAAVRQELPLLAYAPVLCVSALTGQGLGRLPGVVARVAANWEARPDRETVARAVLRAAEEHAPPGGVRVLGAAQVGVRPPAFAVYVTDPERMGQGYERYLENRLRAACDFTGTPVRILFRRRGRRSGKEG